MNGQLYLQQIIHKYKPDNLSSYYSELMDLNSKLKEWANECFLDIFESGSRAKGTAISLASDIDYVVSLTYNCEGTLKNIYNFCFDWLIQYYTARKQPGHTHNHTIFVSKRNSWKKTNIQIHIKDIQNSGRIKEIKLTKIWRELNRLYFPSIYLEYLLITSILKYRPLNDLENNFYYILLELSKERENPLFFRISDPANTNNIMSDLLTPGEKMQIIKKAEASVSKQYWEEIVY